MKQKSRLPRWLSAAITGVAVAGSINLCMGANALTNNFNSAGDIAGWGINFGNGLAEWNATAGPDGSGCLQITLLATNSTVSEVGPLCNPLGPLAFNSADYWLVEYDLMIDPASGFDANSSYGNYQEVLRDAAWSWDSHWVGALGASYNTYTHMSFVIPNNAKNYPMYGFALQGTAPYSTNVVVYMDNLVISPVVNPLIVSTFTNTDISAWGSGQRATLSHSASLEAGGGSPPGSLQVDVAYDDSNAGWQEGLATYAINLSPVRYTYAAFDLYLENPNNLPGPGLGLVQLFLNTGGWTLVGSSISVSTNHVGKWTHIELAMPGNTTASQLIFQFGGGMTNGLRYYLDNVKLYKPDIAPTVKISKPGPQGVQITMNQNGSQWQREAISSPQGSSVLWSEAGGSTVTYSFTIADFPNPVTHEGFETHLFLFNGDTVSTGDQTYGGADWNAADIAIVSIVARTNNGGDYFCQFQWKTNLSNANPPDDALHRPGSLTSSTILGTWSVSFANNTNVTMSGPGGISTNFFFPEEAVLNNFSPATSFLQFGFHKNDNENNGHNDGVSGTFSQVQKTGGSFTFNDTFNGPSLTNNYVWRPTLASAVSHIPPGTAWLINWTLPADGFVPQSAPAITGTWGDAGVTNLFQSGPKMFGQIPVTAVPSGTDGFFRLYKP